MKTFSIPFFGFQIFLLLGSAVSIMAQTNFQTLKSFTYPPDSSGELYDQVIRASDGLLYGTTYRGGSNNVGTLFKINTDGSSYAVVRHFIGAGGDGRFPRSGVVEGSDGLLYGTTEFGGSIGEGTIYKVAKNGASASVLYSFGGADGRNPWGRLIQASDGMLYGTTFSGGTFNAGTVFKIGTNGTGYNVILNLDGAGLGAVFGRNPYAGVIEATDGMLYGVASAGGANLSGTVFKLAKDGGNATAIESFVLGGNNGENPRGSLIEGLDGALYGTTWTAGTNFGSVFKVNKDGTGFVRLHAFGRGFNDEKSIQAGVVQASDGFLYGTASSGGGTNQLGCVYKISTTGTGYAIVRAFDRNGESTSPQAPLIEGPDGFLYGTSVSGGTAGRGTVFKVAKNGTGYSILRSMTYTATEGFLPSADLEEGTDSKLYGTTYEGGLYDKGIVFKIDKNGSGFLVLHHFTNVFPEAWSPYAGVAQGSDGLLYGTTLQGGSNTLYGTIYKLNTNGGSYAVIHDFSSSTTNGRSPYGLILEASDGMLYGTTYQGGASNRGTIYRINKNGTGFALVRSLTGGTNDGQNPYAGVIEGSDGFLYGAAYSGGGSNLGAIFKIAQNGTGHTLLKSFAGGTNDGQNPYTSLMQASDGALYGVTLFGGSNNIGVIFKINTNGTGYTILRHFRNTGGEGYTSYSRLAEGSDAALWGTTYSGGANGFGVVFKINKDGSGYTVVRNFTGTNGEGENPYAGMIKGSDGSLYGMTQYGGNSDVGTIFSLTGGVTVFRPELAASYSQATRKFTVTLTGTAGLAYGIEETTNLTGWTNIANITNISGTTQFTDDASTNLLRRFYRARQLP